MHQGGLMKVFRLLPGMAMVLFLSCSIAIAADFDWLEGMNVRASADPSGFKAQLAARFRIGDTQINAVLSKVDRPADAYMVFRLGEMSNHPPEYVIREYKAGKGKGWGVIAKSLGIKPGSKEFHALKNGSGLYSDDSMKGQGQGKGKGKGKH